jgi:excisionase family DNA binding protein
MAEVSSVSHAAQELGLSEQRIRALIYSNDLPAKRLGRSWFIEKDALERFRRKPRGQGRPLSADNAWALLALLDGVNPKGVPSDVRSRLRRYVRDPDWLLRVVGHSEPRSRVLSLWVPPEDVKALGGYPLVRSGLSAGGAVSRLDVIPRQDESLDAYASEQLADEIEKRFFPEHGVSDPSVILRVPVVPWILEHGDEAPFSVVAADLLDHSDPRVRRAASAGLRSLSRGR